MDIIHSSSEIDKNLDAEKDDLFKTMAKLLKNQTLTDFESVCGSERFPCHKAILAKQSDI